MFRAWRRLRLQNVGDDVPYSTLRRAVEHEALVSLKATDAGVRTPHLVTVVEVGELAMVLAYDAVDGRSLDKVDDGEIDDDVLRGSGARSPGSGGSGSPTGTCAWPMCSSTPTVAPG